MPHSLFSAIDRLPRSGRLTLTLLTMLPIAIVYLLLFSPTTSPLYTFEGMDSAVFMTMGQAVLEGKVLYADLFDNKGPILYFINALGLWLSPGRWGIFGLQVVGMTVAATCMYLTVRRFARRGMSLVAVVLALAFCIPFMQEGNQCEEWAAYGFAVAFYLIVRMLYNGDNEDVVWGGYEHRCSTEPLSGCCSDMRSSSAPMTRWLSPEG